MAMTKKIENSYKKKRYLGKLGVKRKVHNRPVGLLRANHKSTNRIHISWMRKKNLWIESFRNPNSLMESSNMKMLKILHKGLSIGIPHQPMMMISMRKIQLKNL
jgi:hypothetical protein